MIPANEIIRGAQAILNEGCGYIWGTAGQMWTRNMQNAVENGTKMTGDADQTEKTKKYGSKWIGKRVFDCSGLWYYLMSLYGAYVPHGSDSIWNGYCAQKGEIRNGRKENGEELLPGTAVFLYSEKKKNRHHIGVYIGGGKCKCVEAKGTYYGVVESDISHWDEWGEIKGIDYGGDHVSNPVVKRGCVGPEVKTVQELLNRQGYSLDVDGAFGKKTEDAVKDFQTKRGLKADGIVGDKTWAALTSAEPEKPDVPDEPDNLDDKFEIRNPVTGQVGYASRSAVTEVFDAFKAAGIR